MRPISLAFALILAAAPGLSADIGPSRGSLVIVGGNMKDPAILTRFLELAGGPAAPLVIIPTAGGEAEYGPSWNGTRQFKSAGATDVTVLHTTKRDVADSEDFVRPIRAARGVFFTGGRQWRLADVYLNTRTHRELLALLERGGVIGGSSAGATIQGSFLARGDTKGNELMIGDHLEGLGLMRKTAIDQHLLRRNRQFDLLEVIEKYPDLLGIGIDEDTAIVVRGDEFEVIGQSYVAIYDANKRKPNMPFHLLSSGERFDLKKREALRRPAPQQPAR
jgi:cyanophycinase